MIGVVSLPLPAQGQYVRIANAGSIPNGAMVAPTIIKSTLPAYTREAHRRGLDGVVTLQARVDTEGQIEILRIIRSFGLDESAISAVREWVFSPALRNGVPVRSSLKLTSSSTSELRMLSGSVRESRFRL